MDNTSAATHEIEQMPVRSPGYNSDYLELCTHYDVRPMTIDRNRPHEPSDVESQKGILKRRLEQHLLLRASREFNSLEQYDQFADGGVQPANAEG